MGFFCFFFFWGGGVSNGVFNVGQTFYKISAGPKYFYYITILM